MILSSHAVLQYLKKNIYRHGSRFLPVQSPIIMRAQGSHTKPGKDYDDSFADCPPHPPHVFVHIPLKRKAVKITLVV